MNRKTLLFIALAICITALAATAGIRNTRADEWKGYAAAWRSVDSLDALQLPESAQKIVEDIYTHAKAEDNGPQLIKSVIYKAKYTQILQDDGSEKAILMMEKEMQAAAAPEKNILQSLLGEMYFNYASGNSWKISGRTKVDDPGTADISTWDLAAFNDKIIALYTASVSERELLKKTQVSDYADILQPGDAYGHFLRPTLFDMLGHRAVDGLTNDLLYVTQPAYQLKLDHPVLFEDAKDFAGYAFTEPDSAGKKLLALRILQQLTTLHLYDPYPDALIDLNIMRLQFARNNSIIPNKDSLYLQALEREEKQYIRDSSATRYSYLLASWHYNAAAQFDKYEGKAFKWEYQTALTYIDRAISAFPNALGTSQCIALRKSIFDKSLELDAETINTPDMPFRMLVSHRNIDTLHLRVLEASPDVADAITALPYDERGPALEKLSVVRYWEQKLPNDGDHHHHAVEIKIDALKYGRYFIVANTSAGPITESMFSATDLWVSNLTYVSEGTINEESYAKRIFIVDQTTGKPVKGATVNTFRKEYNYEDRSYKRKELQKYTTDANGMFTVSDPLIRDYYSFGFRVQYGKDVMETQTAFYITKSQKTQDRPATLTYLFTDRNIYRPGQTVYFKGIVVESTENGRTKNVVPGHKTTVRMYDVNGQQVSVQEFTTNDYGSFSGTFTAPLNGITGAMRIQNEQNAAYFQVEEYKRPTFKVEMDPLKGDMSVNETATVTGKAIAYSGAVIDNAKVQYRVVRTVRFVYDYYYRYKGGYPSSVQMEIASGTITTDADGAFAIPFTAIPDVEMDKAALPEFTYTVYTDVTDVSGETRSQETSVTIGYHSLRVEMYAKDSYVNNKSPYVRLFTGNLNGTKLDATGKITIVPLAAPKKLYRNRYWIVPDQFLFTEAEFRKLFPLDVYRNENDPESWKELEPAAVINWNTATSDSVALPLSGLPQGEYRIIAEAKDKNGNVIKTDKVISVLDPGAYTAIPQYLFTTTEYVEALPGTSAVINVGSTAKDLHALYSLTRNDGQITTGWITIPENAGRNAGGSMRDIEIPILESDRGGMRAQIIMVRDGRVHSETYSIQVPWDNKDLQVTVETHRDKLQPGAQETWKVKISGKNNAKIAAELLASMYDSSLDALSGPHNWQNVTWPYNYFYNQMTAGPLGNTGSYGWSPERYSSYDGSRTYQYDAINWFGYNAGIYFDYLYGLYDKDVNLEEVMIAGNVSIKGSRGDAPAPVMMEKMNDGATGYDHQEYKESDNAPLPEKSVNLAQVPLRTNFNETAFFYPHLETDSAGNILFTFTMPEALTTWKFMAFAHTKDMQSGQAISSVVTQKELMIQPNMPRFLREGDRIMLTAKISNLLDQDISGNAQLELLNGVNMQPVDAAFGNTTPSVQFNAPAQGSTVVSWEVRVPSGVDAIVYRIKAGNGTFSDGEENGLPVLSNKILVTESLPLWVRGTAPKDFNFTKLINSNTSSTLRHQSVTLEYTSNPAWYAVQALPYMMEYPYECAEQVFSRYYANSIAAHIANSDPEVRRIFDSWKSNPSSLSSNLEKNQELKALMLEETPWVLQAQNETERKKRVALLFDVNRMENEMQSALNKLEKLQLPNGGWPWFKGYEDDPYITQYIVTGLARLEQMGVAHTKQSNAVQQMLSRAVPYCSARMLEEYTLIEKNKIDRSTYVPSHTTLQYLYAYSYFDRDRYPLTKEQEMAKDYFIGQLKKQWTQFALYEKGLIAIIMQRNGVTVTANDIVKSLRENSMRSEEMGMYWKTNQAGYFWYQAPVETQALMVEVFGEVAQDKDAVAALQVWLLRQKQTTDWKTTRATAEACYALLVRGQNLLSNKELAVITVGKLVVQPESTEMGTGYFKTNWLGTRITPELGKITVTPSSGNVLSYGAMYWQYFEDMDKVTTAETNLKLKKQLYLQVNTPTGPELKPITEQTPLRIGDLVKVRIELRSDRDMEYVHMKDMRASGFEPVNVLSQYKWQDGLGYYEATGDASTNFFISYLRKGTYVFEYPVRVTHKGSFSNGITSIQCMYAPEFTSHSEGIRVVVQ